MPPAVSRPVVSTTAPRYGRALAAMLNMGVASSQWLRRMALHGLNLWNPSKAMRPCNFVQCFLSFPNWVWEREARLLLVLHRLLILVFLFQLHLVAGAQ